MRFTGGCHCGAVEVAFETDRAAELQVRACQCSFCRRHGALSVTDPAGALHLTANDDAVLHYTFALRTAQFWVCRHCGVYVAAVIETPSGLFGTLNTRVLEDPDAFQRSAQPADYGGEDAQQRRARRSQRWTPTHLVRRRQ